MGLNGDITFSTLDGKPLRMAEDDSPTGWYANLVDKIGDGEQSRIVDDLLKRGIDEDLAVSARNGSTPAQRGISLLGLTLDEQDQSGGSPTMVSPSKVRARSSIPS